MTRRIPYELLVVTTLAALFSIAVHVADATSRPDDPGTVPPLGQSWTLKAADDPVVHERKAIRIVYQPLVETR